MAVLQMRKINICAMKKNRKKILEFLQRRGCLEIQTTDNEDAVFEKMNTATQISIFERNAALADNALEILDKHCPENKSMFAGLEGKKQIDENEYQKSIDNQQDIMNLVNRILQSQKIFEEKEAAVLRCSEEIESLKPWLQGHIHRKN